MRELLQPKIIFLLDYIGDQSLLDFIQELTKRGILLGANERRSRKQATTYLELFIYGVNCNFKYPFYLGDARLSEKTIQDLFIETADDIKSFPPKDRDTFDGFTECFGSQNRERYCRLVDKYLRKEERV